MGSKRVERLRIQSFRGISDELLLDLREANGNKSLSLILSGDNGSGKSSIVDAIEFCLQGRIGRKHKAISHAVSQLGNKECKVEIYFSDSSSQERKIIKRLNGECESTKDSAQGFEISPTVLRRHYILQFWETPEHEREVLFYDFLKLKQEIEINESQSERIEKLEQERIGIKENRRSLLNNLAKWMKVEIEQIPVDPKLFEEYVLEKVYHGESKKKQKTVQRKNQYQNRGYAKLKPVDRLQDSIVSQVRKLNKKILELQKNIRDIRKETKSISTTSQTAVRGVFENAGQRITDAFVKISPSRIFIEKIEIIRGKITDVSLTTLVYLSNGVKISPREVFSEANLDLLALLIYLAFAKEAGERGQVKFLVLDDVLQSVDSSIRLLATEYILQEFNDWQLVFTVHDRLWQEQLRVLLRRLNHNFVEKEIVKWQPDVGPYIINVSRESNLLLKEALLRGEVNWICSQAGMLLEKVSNVLSVNFKSSVARRKDDKYTLGDLWPGVHKILKKTNLRLLAEETDKWMHLRNLIGAHFNEWANTLSRQEAQILGESVLNLYEATFCETCFRVVEEISTEPKWQCRCGTVSVFYQK